MNQFGFDLSTKEGKKAYAKAYYKKTHAPFVRKNQFDFDLSTKEGRLAYSKAYYKKNHVPASKRKKLFDFDQKTKEGRIAYAKAYRAKYRDPQKEKERMKKWRLGKGREVYLKSKKNYRKNNKDACNESQRRAYVRNVFKGLGVPKELIEAKYLQLMIEREVRSEKRI
jgi:hypothetical protein